MKNYNNKDEFINIYYKNLLKRLLDKFNNLIYLEFINYIKIETQLHSIFSYNPLLAPLTYGIKKLLIDFSESANIKQDLLKQLVYPTNAPIISINNEINVKEGTVSSQVIKEQKSNLTSTLNTINKCYTESNFSKHNKSIIWLPHYGQINITYLDKEIKLLPIQMLILELFNDIDFVSETELLSSPYLMNYSCEFKNNLLESFVKGKLLFKVNKTYVLNNIDTFASDLITIFHSLSNMNVKWEKQIEKEFVHSRQEIIIANINTLLKINKYNYQDIANKLKEQVKLFDVNDMIIDESLKVMLDKDYIVFNTDTSLFEKIYY